MPRKECQRCHKKSKMRRRHIYCQPCFDILHAAKAARRHRKIVLGGLMLFGLWLTGIGLFWSVFIVGFVFILWPLFKALKMLWGLRGEIG